MTQTSKKLFWVKAKFLGTLLGIVSQETMEKTKLHFRISNDGAVATRFWVPLSAWHVLPMPARVLSRVSCPLLLSKVLWLRDIVASAAMRWGCDAARSSHASEVDEWTRSYTSVPLDGSKHRTMIAQRLFVFCFSFLTAHDKLITFLLITCDTLNFLPASGFLPGWHYRKLI